MKRVRQRIIINKDSTKAMWRRFTRLKRERPWVDCLVKAKFLRGSAHCRFRADPLQEEEEEEEEEEFIQNRGGGGVHYQR